MFCTLGQHCLESHIVNLGADSVGIDELGVAEGDRGNSEVLLDSGLVLQDLMLELGLGSEGSQ